MAADLGQLCEVIADSDEGIMLCLDAATALKCSRQNPLRRIWCVFEVFHGLLNEKPLVLKLGRAENPSGAPVAWQWKREWEHNQVRCLAESVDVLRAESTKEEDKERIIAALAESGTGVDTVNGRLTTAVWNAYTTRGQSAFHYAVQGSRELGWAVQNCGVDLEAKNPEGWTALHSAAYSGQVRIVNALLNPIYELACEEDVEDEWLPVGNKKKKPAPAAELKGANVNAQDGKGRTPSCFSAAWQGNLDCIKLLVEAGADLTLGDTYGLRPIDRAKRCYKNGRHSNKQKKDQTKDDVSKEDVPRYKEVVDYLTEVMMANGTFLPEPPSLLRSMSNTSTSSSGSGGGGGGGYYHKTNSGESWGKGRGSQPNRASGDGRNGGKGKGGGDGKGKGGGKGGDGKGKGSKANNRRNGSETEPRRR
eukprot:CAMPEP_0114366892 /NCGR_PEP_ID=MMETSP0101-20121206/29654_1 /TAXON_ID=38822 ORGANISM="Pteridomonas danica, Strain PT" /NCGR_SAMPLE_ID=MMETSP0101 /ASSEMBLY_ACC=CAM_ASM_000211 /LENGTH=419 /DNA_ID=CAMNT_0001516255 /DNA_START=481 /DNA_END=1740 /DNA_ORIENTATION=+